MPLVDRPDTTLAEKQWANQAPIRLYDPPRDGKTPADGSGLPSTSPFYLRDREAKVAQGFTREIVGWDGDWPVLGDAVVPFTDNTYMGRLAGLKKNVEKAIVLERKSRKREIKR